MQKSPYQFKHLFIVICILSPICVLLLYFSNAIENNDKNNWQYTDFDGFVTTYEITFDNNTQLYHLDLIASKNNLLNNCTFINYKKNSNLTIINDIVHNKLYQRVIWSKSYDNADLCFDRKKYKTNKFADALYFFGIFFISLDAICAISLFFQTLQYSKFMSTLQYNYFVAYCVVISCVTIIVGIMCVHYATKIETEDYNNYVWHTFKGYVRSYDINYKNTTNVYSLNLFAEKNDYVRNCIFYEYFIGNNYTILEGIGINQLSSYIKWSKEDDTQNCIKYNQYQSDTYVFNLEIIAIFTLTLGIFHVTALFSVTFALCKKNNHNNQSQLDEKLLDEKYSHASIQNSKYLSNSIS